MAKRGRKGDLDRELEYWDLLASGIRTVEACRGDTKDGLPLAG